MLFKVRDVRSMFVNRGRAPRGHYLEHRQLTAPVNEGHPARRPARNLRFSFAVSHTGPANPSYTQSSPIRSNVFFYFPPISLCPRPRPRLALSNVRTATFVSGAFGHIHSRRVLSFWSFVTFALCRVELIFSLDIPTQKLPYSAYPMVKT